MKKTYSLPAFTMLLFLMVSQLNAQDAATIIQKHIDAHGGHEAIAKIKNIKVTGFFTGFSMRKPFTAIKTCDGKFYSNHHLGKHEIYEGNNGSIAWTIDPWLDIPFARRLNKAEMNRLSLKAEIVTPFYNYEKRGCQLEFKGKENIEGVDVFTLVLTTKDGTKQTWYLDTETFLEYKMESGWTDFAYPTRQYTYFDDFKEVNGVVLPFYYERTFGTRYRVTEIEKVEINVTFNDALFNPPLNSGLKQLLPFVGRYNVKVEGITRRGSWHVYDQTTSEISYKFHNVFVEKIDYQRFFPISREITWTYNEQHNEYRVTITNDFYGSTSLFKGNFNDSSLVIDNTGVSFEDSISQQDAFVKFEFSKILDDGFILNTYSKHDLHAEWQPRERLTYTRIREE